MANHLRVRVGKIDLDTIGAAWILGVKPGDEIQALRGNASPEDLNNANIVCIEVGGSGQVEVNNFDHHGEGSEDLSSASLQAFFKLEGWKIAEAAYESGLSESCIVGRHCACPECISFWPSEVGGKFRVSRYIDTLDIRGPEEIRRLSFGNAPFLSDVVSGIMLVKHSPVEQLLEGIGFLQVLLDLQVDPFGSVQEVIEKHPEYRVYAKAHEHNKLMIAKALGDARWGVTRSGLKMAWLETSFPGALGALYAHGAQVAVAFNPNYNGARKFTVAGNGGIKVNSIQPLLDAVEIGWGGPGSGTILGSPKEGSAMELSEVVRIVRDNL